jgi:hypothetical protein
MGKRKNAFLRIILLLVVFSCSGIDGHSIPDKQKTYPELLPVSNNSERSIFLDIDSADHDQIDQFSVDSLTIQHEYQNSVLPILALSDNLFPSIWQPPKAS